MKSGNKGSKKSGKQNKSGQQKAQKHYSIPRLIVHGSVEKITGQKGLLLNDSVVTGSLLL